MKNEFNDYCKSLGLGTTLFDVVCTLHEQCETLAGTGTLQDIFVSEYTGEGGTRVYETLHFFGKTFVFEVIDFVSAPTIWIARFGPVHINLRKNAFDLSKVDAASRFAANIRWVGSDFGLDLKASSENCPELLKILRTHFLPRALGSE